MADVWVVFVLAALVLLFYGVSARTQHLLNRQRRLAYMRRQYIVRLTRLLEYHDPKMAEHMRTEWLTDEESFDG